MNARQLGLFIGTAIVGILLAVAIFAVLSTTPGHQDLHDQHERLADQQRVIICLILTPPEERGPETIAACQTPHD